MLVLERVPGARSDEYIDRRQIVNFWNQALNASDSGKCIRVALATGKTTDIIFDNETDRAIGRSWLANQGIQPQFGKGNKMKTVIADLQTYLRENRDMVYSVALLLLVDHFIFDGAFRERLRKLVEGFLVKTETKAGIINTTATRVE